MYARGEQKEEGEEPKESLESPFTDGGNVREQASNPLFLDQVEGSFI